MNEWLRMENERILCLTDGIRQTTILSSWKRTAFKGQGSKKDPDQKGIETSDEQYDHNGKPW